MYKFVFSVVHVLNGKELYTFYKTLDDIPINSYNEFYINPVYYIGCKYPTKLNRERIVLNRSDQNTDR